MPKFKKETITIINPDDREVFIKIEFDAYVNAQGFFYMKFNDETAKILNDAGIKTESGTKDRKGYLYASTYEELKQKVEETAKEYISRELISEKWVISYCIQTMANYAIDKNGDVAPNPSKKWTDMEYGLGFAGNKWHEGNIHISATHPSPFGLLMYAKPFIKREYKYRSGKCKSYYHKEWEATGDMETQFENGYNLQWLNAVPCISKPERGNLQEIDYNENVAEFFVSMIKSICKLSAAITDFLNPEHIELLASKKQTVFSTLQLKEKGGQNE